MYCFYAVDEDKDSYIIVGDTIFYEGFYVLVDAVQSLSQHSLTLIVHADTDRRLQPEVLPTGFHQRYQVITVSVPEIL